MINEEYFNSLLEIFHTEENKNRFITNAVKRDITDKPEHIKIAFEHYKNSPVNLGILFYKIGNHTYALNLYKEELEKIENKINLEADTNYDMTAIERRERIKDKLKIVDLSSRIASINKNWGDSFDDLSSREEADKYYTKALQICEAIGEFKDAAEIAEEMGQKGRAEKYKDIHKLLNPECVDSAK